MRRIAVGFVVAVFTLFLGGCDQAQKALDTIDKAKAFKDDVEKTANEVADKARGLIPGNDRRDGEEQRDYRERGDRKENGEGRGEKDD